MKPLVIFFCLLFAACGHLDPRLGTPPGLTPARWTSGGNWDSLDQRNRCLHLGRYATPDPAFK